MQNLHFININKGENTAKGKLLNKFDYEISDQLYEKFDENDVPIIYDLLYKYVKQLPVDKKCITFSPDCAISSSTISAIGEKHLTITTNISDPSIAQYNSKLKVLFISPNIHIADEFAKITTDNLSSSIISNLMCVGSIYTYHEVVFDPSQFLLYGLNNLTIEDEKILSLYNITYLTNEQIEKKGLVDIINYINSFVNENPLHIVFDIRFVVELILKNKFSLDYFNILFDKLKINNVVGLDIVGFYFGSEFENLLSITKEVAKIPLVKLFNIKEKKINIINENTKFLIWRPFTQLSEDDVGWFILRGMTFDEHENIIKKLEQTEEKFIIHPFENDDGEDELIMITLSSIEEQQSKTYYDDNMTVNNCVLFPEEKTSMVFEIVNSTIYKQ